MAFTLHHRSAASHHKSSGITLVELLVVIAVGAIVLTGAIAMVVSHIRSSSMLAALLRLQDQCGRVQFLINHEIQQASLATDSGGALSLSVPGLNTPIQYSLEDGALKRSGPAINAEGKLIPNEPSDEVVVRGVTRWAIDTSNPRSPRYVLTVQDANGVSYTTTSDSNTNGTPDQGAHCRVREITSGGS